MDEPSTGPACGAGYELRFTGLFDRGRGFAFACDADGRVDIDRLSDRARNNYFYAWAAVGRELSAPTVVPLTRPRPVLSTPSESPLPEALPALARKRRGG